MSEETIAVPKRTLQLILQKLRELKQVLRGENVER